MRIGGFKVCLGLGMLFTCGQLASGSDAAGAAETAPSSSPRLNPSAAAEKSDKTPKIDFDSIYDKFPGKPDLSGGLFRPSSSGVMPSGPVRIPSARSRRALDESKNWEFTTPDDQFRSIMANDILRMPEFAPDGRDKNTYSAVERFYDRSREGGGNNTPSPNAIFDLRSYSPQATASSSSSSASDATAPASINFFATPGYESAMGNRPVLGDFSTGLTPAPASPVDVLRARDDQQQQLDAFKKAMGVDVGSLSGIPGLSSVPTASSSRSMTALPAVPGLPSRPDRNPYNPAVGSLPVNAAVGSLPTSASSPTTPGYETRLPENRPASVTPPKPDFSIPRRPF